MGVYLPNIYSVECVTVMKLRCDYDKSRDKNGSKMIKN